MAAELKPYPDYKDSGVEWLGKVPAHWKVERLKCSLAHVVQQAAEPPRMGTVVALENVESWTGRVVMATGSGRSFDSQLKIFRSGDVLFGKLRPYLAKVARLRSDGLCVGEFLVLRPRHGSVKGAYFKHFLRSKPVIDTVTASTFGAKMPRADWQFLGGIPVVRPPVAEQAAIVRFLDHADRRIRRYIRAKEKLIALLQEQKQAVVHEAVTGRIDVRTGRPYSAYKDSKVEWLGDIPEHWYRTRLKAMLYRPTRNGLFKKKEHFGTGVPLVNVADVYRDDLCIDASSLERVEAEPDEIRRFRIQDGDIFFVRSSLKLEGTGRAAIATNCSTDTVFECHLVQARPDVRRVNPRYLVAQLSSHAFRHYLISRANTVTMATVAQDTISSCPVVTPRRAEQDGVVEWTDRQWRQLSRVIEDANRQIVLLREYRSRLIADVVTGKLDVREVVAGFPEVDPLTTEGDPVDGIDHGAGSDLAGRRHAEAGGPIAAGV